MIILHSTIQNGDTTLSLDLCPEFMDKGVVRLPHFHVLLDDYAPIFHHFTFISNLTQFLSTSEEQLTHISSLHPSGEWTEYRYVRASKTALFSEKKTS